MWRIGFVATLAASLVAGVGGPLLAAQYVVDQQHASADDGNAGTAARPLKTIGAALARVAPGDTTLVKAGIYREDVRIAASGQPEQPITLKAAPGERVVVSGADPVTGWRQAGREEVRGNPNWQKIYVAEVAFKTRSLFQDGRQLPVARWPKVRKTKLMSQSGDATRLVDAVNLTQPAGFWDGGILTVRDASTTNYDSGTITAYDAAKHELVVDKPRRVELEGGKDEYFIKNVPSIITRPGEWSIDTSAEPCRIYLWPLGDADPNTCSMEAAVRGARRLVMWEDGVGHLVIDGLEIRHALDLGLGAWGSESKRGHDVVVQNCIIHHNGGGGIDIGFNERVAIRRCIVARNGSNGIGMPYNNNCLVEECEVFGNAVDGIVFGWYAQDNLVRRNYVHNQWDMTHPDGFQTFRNVNVLALEDNLFLNTGQGWQCETTHQSTVTGNMWIGTRGGTLNLSPRDYKNKDGTVFKPNCDFVITRNTLAFNGQNNVSLLDTFIVTDNVMSSMGWMQPGANWQRDYNLYIDYRPDAATQPFNRKGVAGGTFAETNDTHSRTGNPKFLNAPENVYKINGKKFDQCTPSKLYLSMSSGDFAAGDHVELNWDGRVRKVTEVGGDYVVFAPPLEYVHPYGWDVVGNWRGNRNFALDLRLAKDSPGRGMGQGGKDVGSTIDIQAYARGDFDGDGRRDLPPPVKDLESGVHEWDE